MPKPVRGDVTPIDPATAPLSIGTLAPDFALSSTPAQQISLSDYRGRPVVLVFYPADWSAVCGQMAFYNSWSDVSPILTNPGAAGIPAALESLRGQRVSA
jgi:peroxiredoxin